MMAKRGGVTKAIGVTSGTARSSWRLAGYSRSRSSCLERTGAASDPNAVAVVATVEAKGSAWWLLAPAACASTRLMDHGIQIKAVMERLVGGVDGLYYGMRLRVAI